MLILDCRMNFILRNLVNNIEMNLGDEPSQKLLFIFHIFSLKYIIYMLQYRLNIFKNCLFKENFVASLSFEDLYTNFIE